MPDKNELPTQPGPAGPGVLDRALSVVRFLRWLPAIVALALIVLLLL